LGAELVAALSLPHFEAPVTANCSSHWFDARRGVAAVAWYEQGVRFLDYSRPRRIRQVGYYIPFDGSTWAAYWSPTDKKHEIVYTADAQRGVDVIRIRRGGRAATTVNASILAQVRRDPDGTRGRLPGIGHVGMGLSPSHPEPPGGVGRRRLVVRRPQIGSRRLP
jgi:hypothetical protein